VPAVDFVPLPVLLVPVVLLPVVAPAVQLSGDPTFWHLPG